MTITAAADGSSLGNPGPTGWAWYIDDGAWAAGGFPTGTNNIGELTAVAELLDATAAAGEPLHILCDSKYVIDSCTKWMRGWKHNGWKKKDGKPVLNVELMQRIDAALQGRKVTFQWVKGHAGHPENEAADERARAAATAFQAGRAADAGPGFGGAGSHSSGIDDAEFGAVADDVGDTESPAVENARDAEALDVRGDGLLPLWADEAPDAGDDDGAGVVALERSLVDPGVRANPALLEELLHEDLEYVGADGAVSTRAELLARLATSTGPAPEHVGPVRAHAIAPGVQVVRAEETVDGRPTAHTSMWVFEPAGPGDGRWRMRFHQVTPIA